MSLRFTILDLLWSNLPRNGPALNAKGNYVFNRFPADMAWFVLILVAIIDKNRR